MLHFSFCFDYFNQSECNGTVLRLLLFSLSQMSTAHCILPYTDLVCAFKIGKTTEMVFKNGFLNKDCHTKNKKIYERIYKTINIYLEWFAKLIIKCQYNDASSFKTRIEK